MGGPHLPERRAALAVSQQIDREWGNLSGKSGQRGA
jgi:hypothetical protein